MSSTTTMGVRLDEATRERIKNAAQRLDRTSHWLIKQAIYNYLEQLDNGQAFPELAPGIDVKKIKLLMKTPPLNLTINHS